MKDVPSTYKFPPMLIPPVATKVPVVGAVPKPPRVKFPATLTPPGLNIAPELGPADEKFVFA